MVWAAGGKNFSERILGSKQQLIESVHTALMQMYILGQSPDRAIGSLAKAMGTSRNQTGRLIMTESAFFGLEARKDSFRELGVERYEIVATLDSSTSEICREMDGKVFPMSEYESSMTYPEWKESFVDGGDKSGLQGIRPDDKISSMNDITQEWTRTKEIKGSVAERQEYTVNGATYQVDGKHVILRPTTQEREIADVLGRKYGKRVEHVPQVVFPQGIQTPDYLIDGDRFDLKSPTGRGRNVVYGLIAKKRKQADNFIIDASNCPLSIEEIEAQIESLYTSPRVGFLEMIVLMKNGDVLKVYGRK